MSWQTGGFIGVLAAMVLGTSFLSYSGAMLPTSNKAGALALAEFFRRRPDRLREYGLLAAKRATGRAWKFAMRNKVSRDLRFNSFAQYLGVRAGLIRPSIELLESTTRSFRKGFVIR